MEGEGPPILKSSWRSWNWPWMSPQMVTGTETGWTLDSSIRTSRALSHSVFTSDSESGVHVDSFSRNASTDMVSKTLSKCEWGVKVCGPCVDKENWWLCRMMEKGRRWGWRGEGIYRGGLW